MLRELHTLKMSNCSKVVKNRSSKKYRYWLLVLRLVFVLYQNQEVRDVCCVNAIICLFI